jgi:hypothetical protein
MYRNLREWVPTAALPDDKLLIEDLVAPQYGFDGPGRLRLEAKADLKKRVGRSPDAAASPRGLEA